MLHNNSGFLKCRPVLLEHSFILRFLGHRARRVLVLFSTQELIQSSEVASLLGISVRQIRDLLTGWVKDGWLEVADPSKRGRKYRLEEEYRALLE